MEAPGKTSCFSGPGNAVLAETLLHGYKVDQSSVIFPDFPEFMISKPSR